MAARQSSSALPAGGPPHSARCLMLRPRQRSPYVDSLIKHERIAFDVKAAMEETKKAANYATHVVKQSEKEKISAPSLLVRVEFR